MGMQTDFEEEVMTPPEKTPTPKHTKIKVERVQTGIRIEKRMLKVLKR
jgi:hypothetical protein